MKRIWFSVVALAIVISTVAANQYCVDEEEAAYIREQEMSAPSPAPSISLECTTQTSNARGRYTSTVSPCTFEFHKADAHQRELDLIRFHTSDLCSSENSFLTVREYVRDFPDECVADFQRCYSLEHHRTVIWDFLCAKGWEIPQGTTHVSVDCRKDRDLVMQATSHRREEMKRDEHEAKLDTYESKLFNLGTILGVCLVGVYAISNLIVKPLVAARQVHATLLTATNNNGNGCGDGNGNGNGGCDPRNNRRSYQPLHNPGSVSISVGDNSSEGAIMYGGEHHPSHIFVSGAEETGGAETTSTSLSQEETQMMEDFDSQIPDFDAVPITFPHSAAAAAAEEAISTTAAYREHSDDTTDSSTILPLSHHPQSATAPESSLSSSSRGIGSNDTNEMISIQTAAASIISSVTTRRSSSGVGAGSSNGRPMEVELVNLVPEEPDDIPIVPATILYS